MKKTALIIFTMILIGTISVNAQVLLRESTDTSLIMSFLPKNLNSKRIIKTIVVTTDFSKEKAIVDTAKIPFLYGKPVSKSISISEGSSWSDGESSYTALKISSPGASSLSLNFSKFALSGSALLYIYNEDHDMILGPITSKENNNQGTYGIAPLKGGAVTVLLREKDTKSLKTGSQIVISEVIIGYRDVYKSQQSAKSLNDSGPCMVDIACREDWDGRPTARYFTGGSQCTGALVNNENNDGRPFFLTAFHCLDSDNDGTLNANEVNATSNYTFQFFYRRETCLGSVLNSVWQFYGATWRAAYEGTDFALVELFNALPIESNLSLYGWNRSNTPPNWGASIHHPSGDVQKISFTGLIQTSTFSANMWGVEWNLGVTEGGSSGAPLFNESKQVIGQLRGGSSSCSNPTLNDRFGKFGKSWDLQPLAHTQLKYWLSPNQDLFEIAPLDRGLLTGPSNICYGQNATYNMPNLPSGYTITWSVSSQLNIVSSTAGSVTVSPISINSSENGYIRASLNGVVFREYKVIVGVPAPAVSIRMYHSACIGGSDWEASFDITPVTPNLQYIWIYNGAEYPPSTSPDFSIYEFPANPITLNLRVKTSCGISPKLLANDATYYPPCGFSWLISPNPSSTEFEVSKNSGGSSKTVDQKQAFQVTLLDNTGKTIRTGSSSSGSTKINVESVPNGTYFIHINDGTQTIKIMCQGTKAIPLYFSAQEIGSISSHISNYGMCLFASSFFEMQGPDKLTCGGSANYSLPSIPGASYSWSIASPFIITSSPGPTSNSITLASSNYESGYQTLSCTISGVTDCPIVITKYVGDGTPPAPEYLYIMDPQDGNLRLCPNTTYQIEASGSTTTGYLTNWYWVLPPGWSSPNYGGGSNQFYAPSIIGFSIQIKTGPDPVTSFISVRGVNACGLGDPVYLGVSTEHCGGVGLISIYPNPADQEISVEQVGTDKNLTVQTADRIQILDDRGKVIKSLPNNGKQTKLTLTTADLPNGRYFLHVYKGKEITKKQIIIKH